MTDPEPRTPTDGSGPTSTTAGANTSVLNVDRGNEADLSPPRGQPFPIVGVGGSAGALDAMVRLLQAIPENPGIALVFVLHLDPHHESQLPEILAKNSSMPVRSVADGTPVRPNEVYVIPPNVTLILEGDALRLLGRGPGLHLPIDAFFRSLANVQGGRAVGVVLSGNGSDGSEGVKAIKADCGLTFAQSDETAMHVSMPRSAVATGAVDYVLSPADIARELVYLSHHPFVRPPQPDRSEAETLPDGDGEVKKIFQILRNRTRVDFAHYKANTVRRRIGRRMVVTRTRTLGEYVEYLEGSADEVQHLYRDLLISVTNFFRDPQVFDALTSVLKERLVSRKADQPFRVWVPGCATGEEVYSLAICLTELADDVQPGMPLQLFGTDISEVALDGARSANYPDIIAQDVSPGRLSRFFVTGDRGYHISKQIRESCIFARQDITQDAPFGNMDLISCRNLLIYLDTALQRRVLPIFHYSLKENGLLVLGSAESIVAAGELFIEIDHQHRIYGRKQVPLALTLHSGGGATAVERLKAPFEPQRTTLGGIELQKKADLVLQSRYTPAAVVIDSGFQILHFRGRTGAFLEPSPGEPTFDLLRMARETLTTPVRKAVHAASAQNTTIRETGLILQSDGNLRRVEIEVTPIAGASQGESYYLVVFQGLTDAQIPNSGVVEPQGSSGYAASLEDQLHAQQKQNADLRESLRNANEDYEANVEELRSANEEIRSANEELLSTNEELSTTKEELQSANEELTTVNEELQNRNQELGRANSDLINLLAAVNVAFLMLDNDLRLRRYSVAAERVLGVKPTDVGFPMKHFQRLMDVGTLDSRMQQVLENLTIDQSDIQDSQGRWYSVTIRPYRTVDARIAGVVVVFLDIDPLKRMLSAAEEARDYAEGIIETVREPLLVLDGDLRIQRATASFYDLFQVSRSETEGRFLYDLGNGQWNVPRLRELLGNAVFRNEAFQDFEIVHEFPHVKRRRMRLSAKRISLDNDRQRRLLLAIEDVTERREEAEVRYQRLFETAKDGILIFDAETEKLTDVNAFFLELTGFGREQLMGRRAAEMECFRAAGPAMGIVSEAREHEVSRHDDVQLVNRDGRFIVGELLANSYAVGGQQVVQVNVRDVTRRNQTVSELRESEERFRLFVDSVRDYALFQTDPGGRIVSWNSGAERLLRYTESEIIGQPIARLFTPQDVSAGEPERELDTARTSGCSEDERWHVRKDGSRFFASGVLTTVRDQSGRLRGFAKVMQDITETRQVQEQLQQQAQILEFAQDLVIVRRLDGTIVFWNGAAAETYGWSKAEAVGQLATTLLAASFPEPVERIESLLISQGRWEGEVIHTRRNGTKMTVWSRWALQLDSKGQPLNVLEINSDITERQRAENQLRTSLREKEVLLKEIHHRVKNNLQIIASLLNLQAEHLVDARTQAILEEMNTRVRSIAAIHEMLYGAPDLSRIEFSQYLVRLTKDVSSVYSAHARAVRVNVTAEPLWLELTQAVPSGLIVNELVSNSLKHAFPGKREGVVEVAFRSSDSRCFLEVSDNGVGLPPDVDLEDPQSMGLRLLNLLMSQLGGVMEVDRSKGTRFAIAFPLKQVPRSGSAA